MRVALVLLLGGVLAACQSADDVSTADLAESPASGGAAAEPPPSSASFAIPAAPPVARELVRTGTLRVRARDHASAVARARTWTQRLGGTVAGEESARHPDAVETTLTLRVPAARFDSLLSVLSATPGDVEARTVAVEDVTRAAADLDARLRVRRAAETRLLALLDRAASVNDVLAVQSRLDALREEIESAEAQRRAIATDVAYSTLRATFFETSATGLGPGTGWLGRAGRAIVAGWDGFLGVLLAVVALWPAWLLLGGAWAARRAWRRRRAPGMAPRAGDGA